MKNIFLKSLIIVFIAFISYSTLTYAAETVDSDIQSIVENLKKEGYTKNELKEYLIKNDIEISSLESIIDSVYLTDKEKALQKLNNLDKGITTVKEEVVERTVREEVVERTVKENVIEETTEKEAFSIKDFFIEFVCFLLGLSVVFFVLFLFKVLYEYFFE